MKDELENMNYLRQLPISFYWKEKNGKYAEVNKIFLQYYNQYTEDDFIGRKDVDLWSENTINFHLNDKKVIFFEKKEVFVEEQFTQNKKYFYLSIKNPWYSATGKLLGIYGASIALNCDDASNQLTNALTILNCHQETHNLAPRQKECLCYLVKGMSIKQIAKALGLAPKTVEHYLEATRKKLKCSNRQELIMRAFQLGIL